jgi:hypothetical protein
MPGAGQGNRHDASCEEEPNRRVQELDAYQKVVPLGLALQENRATSRAFISSPFRQAPFYNGAMESPRATFTPVNIWPIQHRVHRMF